MLTLCEEVDTQLRRLCRDIEVPRGLKNRLYRTLDIQPDDAIATSKLQPAQSKPMNSGPRRRWLMGVMTSAAGLALLLGGTWFWRIANAPAVSLDELCRKVLVDFPPAGNLQPFETFSDGRGSQIPTTMETLALTSPVRVMFEGEPVAVYLLSLPVRGRSPAVTGFLLAVPVSRVVDVPAAEAFLAAGPNYRRLGYCSTAWVEGDFAYLCCVSGGENNLRRLLPPRPVAA